MTQQPIATEALIQRGRSPLYNDLIVFMSDIQMSLDGAPSEDLGAVYRRLRDLRFESRLKTIIDRHMAVPQFSVYLNKDRELNMGLSVLFQTDELKKKKRQTETFGTLLAQFDRYFDDRQSKFAEVPEKEIFGLSFCLHFNAALFFVRQDDASYFITAEEVAALVLHELGHIVFFVTTYGRAREGLTNSSDIIDYLKRSPDHKAISELVSVLEKNKAVRTTWGDQLKIVKQQLNKSQDLDDPVFQELISTLSTIVVYHVSGGLLSVGNTLLSATSSRVKPSTFEVDNERTADEFAARHGATPSLTMGLIKLYGSMRDYKDIASKSLSPFYIQGLTELLGLARLYLDTHPEECQFGYDPLIGRMKLMLETSKHAFHDEHIPSEVQDELKRSIKTAQTYIDAYEKADYRKVRLALKMWRDNIVKFGRLLQSPFQNRFMEYHDRLQNATRSLSRHGLYYWAKK